MTARSTSTTLPSLTNDVKMYVVGALLVVVSVVTSAYAYISESELAAMSKIQEDLLVESQLQISDVTRTTQHVSFSELNREITRVKTKILAKSAQSTKWEISATAEELDHYLRIAYSAQTPLVTLDDLASLVWIESRFNKHAKSNMDAKGLTQIRKQDWKEVLGKDFDPFDPYQSIHGCVKVLTALKSEHHTKDLAITRYNGSGPVARQYLKHMKYLTTYLKS